MTALLVIHPLEVGFDARQDFSSLAWPISGLKPLAWSKHALRVIAAACTMTQGHDICGNCARAVGVNQRNPVVCADYMPQARGTATDRTAMAEIGQATLPFCNRVSSGQVAICCAAKMDGNRHAKPYPTDIALTITPHGCRNFGPVSGVVTARCPLNQVGMREPIGFLAGLDRLSVLFAVLFAFCLATWLAPRAKAVRTMGIGMEVFQRRRFPRATHRTLFELGRAWGMINHVVSPPETIGHAAGCYQHRRGNFMGCYQSILAQMGGFGQ
jgi:hypothetical protein